MASPGTRELLGLRALSRLPVIANRGWARYFMSQPHGDGISAGDIDVLDAFAKLCAAHERDAENTNGCSSSGNRSRARQRG